MSFPKNKRYESKDFIAYIKTLPCLVCGKEATAHHWITVGAGGSDLTAVPLCQNHHTSEEGFHVLGRDTFTKRYNIDIQWLRILYLEGYIMEKEAK
jgi:hypothetical protein